MAERKKILLVDDEESILGITESMLQRIAEKHGLAFDIHKSSDPTHVLYDLVYQQKDDYDLILLDVRMPKVYGEEIYRSMQMMESDAMDKVIFVTAYPDDLTQAIFGTPLKVLRKPFRMPTIEKLVLHMFGMAPEGEEVPWEVMENKP